jgi:hypothetical protein
MSPVPHPAAARSGADRFGRRFAVAWMFLLISAALGVGLRLQLVSPVAGLNYGFLLHTHSHVAFLGWVFNAFFVAALRHFIPPEAARGYDVLWWTMQVGVLGMMATFPFQGYAFASITFATLHTGAAAVFAGKLWRGNCAAPAARVHLRAALGFMLLSGLGPIALGPLAALGLRESPVYTLSIYFYLHCQYNGWFLFFLQALLLQRRHEAGYPADGYAAIRAARWLASGCLLTYALSALWIQPPAWVQGLAAAGGLAQIIGCVELWRAVRGTFPPGAGLPPLEWIAAGGFGLKHGLQLAAALPGLAGFAHERFIAIAFLHLIFLGIVTPALIAWARENGWFPPARRQRPGLLVFLGGAAATELLLLAPAAAGLAGQALALPLPLPHALLAASVAILIGLLALGRPGHRGGTAPHHPNPAQPV